MPSNVPKTIATAYVYFDRKDYNKLKKIAKNRNLTLSKMIKDTILQANRLEKGVDYEKIKRESRFNSN